MVTKTAVCMIIKNQLLVILTLVGVLLGIGLGFGVRVCSPSQTALLWLGLPGQLYLRLLKMTIVPLIVSSVTTGTGSLDPRANGKISLVAFVYVFITNMLGTILGMISFFVFRPGVETGKDNVFDLEKPKPVDTNDVFADMLRNIIPDNLFEATFQQSLTEYIYAEKSNNSTESTLIIVKKMLGKANGPNLLGLIFACTMFGMAATSLKGKAKPLLEFLDAVAQSVMVIILWIMWTTPVGVFSLILVSVAGLSDVGALFHDLGMFIAAVVVACVVQQLIVLPIVLFVSTRRNPYKHLFSLTRPWLIAFASCSTAMVIPEMFRCCESDLRIDKRIVRFVIPFCVTISANGSAVFIMCSCLFLSNLAGFVHSVGNMFVLGFLVTMSAFAIPPVPSASIVTIVMILTSFDIPVEPIALLLAIDFFLDRVRTTSSVVSHTMCASVTYYYCKNRLTPIPDTAEDDVEIDVTVEQQEKLLSINRRKSETDKSEI